MTIQNAKLIVFDLDGTIADTAPDIRVNLNKALGKWGLSPYGLEDVKRFVGQGARIFAARALRGRATELKALGISNDPEDQSLLERFFADHMSFYKKNDNSLTTLYDGVYAFLKSAPMQLALYTNKPGVPTERLLRHFNIEDCFVLALHADNVPRHKPDPVGLFQIMSVAGASLADTVMVGDGIPDMQVAKAAGVRSVALNQGNTKASDLSACNPDWQVDTFKDFVQLLEK